MTAQMETAGSLGLAVFQPSSQFSSRPSLQGIKLRVEQGTHCPPTPAGLCALAHRYNYPPPTNTHTFLLLNATVRVMCSDYQRAIAISGLVISLPGTRGVFLGKMAKVSGHPEKGP